MENTALDESVATGKPALLPGRPAAKTGRWQELQAHLSYWRSQLNGSLPVLELPLLLRSPSADDSPGGCRGGFTRDACHTTEDVNKPAPTPNGAVLGAGSPQPLNSLVLPKSLREALQALAQQERASLFEILLAAFKTLLYRYTGTEDITVGCVRPDTRADIGGCDDGTGTAEAEPIVLPLRTRIEGNPSYKELLHRVRQVTSAAIAHNLPLDTLLEELQLSQTPPFQVMFGFQSAPHAPAPELPEPSPLPKDSERRGGKESPPSSDLSLWVTDTGQELIAFCECSAPTLDPRTITRMLGHFQTLLEGIAANPEQPIGLLPVLTEAERHQLPSLWNGTQTEIPDVCIHQLFEAQVERTPDAVAVMFEDAQCRVASLQYRQLNERANQLAHYLRSLGVGPEVLVGLYLERSLEMIVGMLGILKAGGAYLPLDPAYSKERLNFMLSDAGVPVLLTQSKLRAELLVLSARVICLDSEWETIKRESEENHQQKATADSLAYVIYTSGSTGKPKGVMIEHRSLVNYIQQVGAGYGISQSDRILQFASISFDASAEEIYPCLTRGATLCLRTDSMLDTVPGFLQKCGEWGITVLDLPTAYWHELTASLEAETLALPPTVRLAIIGGEKALPERLALWRKHCPQVRLVNTYGPTEATVVAAMCDLSGESSDVPLIGRAIGNGLCCVLDRHLQPVPVGVPGELYIGGALLARGYLNRPDLTAQKFIPNPFLEPGLGDLGVDIQGDNFVAQWATKSANGPHPMARLYKTGDLVRYLADGNLEFLGRTDDQVKIRGFRIELGEIEAALRQHPAAGEVAVTVLEDAPGNKRLVAYVVPAPGVAQPKFPLAELRTTLTQKLPPYMVPSAFVVLEKMPVTPNGKIDRRSLPAPDTQKADLEATQTAPTNPVEEAIAGIFAEVLGREQVGVGDNFFELGGHSLIASQMVSRLRDNFGIELPLRSLFETPTPRGLASAMLQDSAKRLKLEKTAQLLLIVAQLSDEEVQTMLEEKISLGKKEVCLR